MESADMREVWKRLEDEFPVGKYCHHAPYSDVVWLLNLHWFPSAMQGCKL